VNELLVEMVVTVVGFVPCLFISPILVKCKE